MFPILSWDQANPGITGAQKVNDIFQRILENQKLGIQNRYMPDTLQAELAKKQEEAKYYAPNILSEINLRKNQGLAAGAHAGLMNAQTGQVAPLAQSEIAFRKMHGGLYGAQTKEQELLNDIYSNITARNRQAMQGQQQPQHQEQTATPQPQYGYAPYRGEQYTPETTNEISQQPDTLQQNIDDVILRHPNENPEAYAQLMAKRQQQNAYQTNPTLSQAAQQLPQQAHPQLSNDEQNKRDMLAIADIQAMKRGVQLPSMEAENAGERERAVLNARALEKSAEGYLAAEKGATNSLQYLNELERSIKKLPNIATAPYIPEQMKKMLGSTDMQVAIKSATGLMLGQLKSTFGGLGQMRLMEMIKLMEALPNSNMGTEAAIKVIGQVRNVLEISRAKGGMTTQLNYLTKDNVEREGLMNMAERVCNPVDSEGRIHPEATKYWKEYAKPEALNALRRGELYIPDKIPTKYLSNDALRQLGAS